MPDSEEESQKHHLTKIRPHRLAFIFANRDFSRVTAEKIKKSPRR
jgi:hypothetical protein